MAATPADVLKLGRDAKAEFLDIRFSDLPGLMQHFTMPFDQVTEDGFEEGFGFDGSSWLYSAALNPARVPPVWKS